MKCVTPANLVYENPAHAIKHGNMYALKWFYEQGVSLYWYKDSSLPGFAVSCNQLNCLKFILDHITPKEKQRCLNHDWEDIAYISRKHNYGDIFCYYFEIGGTFGGTFVFKDVEYLVQKFPFLIPSVMDRIFDSGICLRKLLVDLIKQKLGKYLPFWYETAQKRECEVWWDEKTCEAAARIGDIQSLVFMHKHGCAMDPQEIAEISAKRDYVQCFAYALAHGATMFSSLVKYVVECNSFGCFVHCFTVVKDKQKMMNIPFDETKLLIYMNLYDDVWQPLMNLDLSQHPKLQAQVEKFKQGLLKMQRHLLKTRQITDVDI